MTACRACTCGRCSASFSSISTAAPLTAIAGRAVPVVSGPAPADQFAVRTVAARHSGKRAPHAGDRLAEQLPDLGRSTRSPRPSPALPAGCWRRRPSSSRSMRLSFQRSAEVLVMLVLGGAGRLYGGLDRRHDLHGRARSARRHEPAILVFLARPAADRRHYLPAQRHSRRLRASSLARWRRKRMSDAGSRNARLNKNFGSLVVAAASRSRCPRARAMR